MHNRLVSKSVTFPKMNNSDGCIVISDDDNDDEEVHARIASEISEYVKLSSLVLN